MSTLIVFIMSLTAAAAEPAGKVAELRGEAFSTSLPKGLSEGSPIYAGDRVTTNEGTMARIVLDGGIALQLGANTQTKIERPDKESTRVTLFGGGLISRVRALVRGATKPAYEVRAGGAVMGVRGTVFFVQAAPKKPTFLCTCNGTVAVKWKGRETVIKSEHHDAPKFLAAKGKLEPAPMGNDHSDADAEALQKLLDGS